MSNNYYNQKWQEALNDLMDQVALENQPLDQNEKTMGMNYKRSDQEWFQHYALLYIKYIDTYKKLEDCFDQMIHPQKRILLKEMLENTIIRLIEVKHELIKYNTHTDQVRSDFISLDQLLQDLKLDFEAIEIQVPRFFKEDVNQTRQERNQLIDKFLVQFHGTSEPEEEVLMEKSLLDENIEYAIRTIQKIERGRQGIERAYVFKFKLKEKQKEMDQKKQMALGIEIGEEHEQENAIQTIQKYYRGFKAREHVYSLRQQELEFLGMTINHDRAKETFQIHNEQRIKQKLNKQHNEQIYQGALVTQKIQVKINEGPDIKEKMLSERRKWILNFMEQTDFSQIPNKPEEFYEREQVMMPLTPEEQEARRAELEAKDKEVKKKKDAKKAGKAPKKTEAEEFMDDRKAVGPSEIVIKIQDQIENYNKIWLSRDEGKNFGQKHEDEIAKILVKPTVEEEIQKNVDEMISIELDNLRLEHGIKKGKPKPKPKPKAKPKPKKVPGMAFCKNRDPRDMLAELIEAGICKKLQQCLMKDFIGEANLIGSVFERSQEMMPDPSNQQLRQIITETIAMPLGSSYIKSKVPNLNYFLFYGSMGSGKTMMTRALAHECDAIVLDISPTNLEGKYMDKAGTNKMMYMVFTCAKVFQPAIILMNDLELVFQGGKKKKAGGFTRLKKPIQDFKKAKYVEPTDQVAFIACTSKPFECSTRDLKIFFDKKYYFPYPNYATRKLLFQKFVKFQNFTIGIDFPVSTIAHITEGYSAGSFKMVCEKILTQRRKMMLTEKPLHISEFIGPFSNTFMTYKQDYDKILAFTDDVTGLKERREKKKNPVDQNDPKKNNKKGKK